MTAIDKPRVRVPAGSVKAGYFNNERSPFMVGWSPSLRTQQADVLRAYLKAAGRAVDALQNSGFVKGIVERSMDMVVGAGLKMAAKPDIAVLGWTEEEGAAFATEFERRFYAWANDPLAFDAGGQLTIGQMQQVLYGSWSAYGEAFGFAPYIKRRGIETGLKMMPIEPSRVSQDTSEMEGLVQGVYSDGYGLPYAYKIREKGEYGWFERKHQARDRYGMPLVWQFREPALNTTRGISPLAPVMKVIRQYDQVFDAVVTRKLTRAVFAGALKSSMTGTGAFDGLMTDADRDKVADYLDGFMDAKGEFYDGASIDLTQHGRIMQLFPGDEFQFIEATGEGELQDKINEWMLREMCQGFGVMYETGSGDFRGATYSSIRMGGAMEWLTVIRRRYNLIVPFCRMVAEMFLDEEIGSGRMKYPGGYPKFRQERKFAAKTLWSGPARPQADDFKTAKAFEVLLAIGSITLEDIAAEYGRDWYDMMEQQQRENEEAERRGLPRPHAPRDMLQAPEELREELEDDADDKNERKRKKPATRDGDGDGIQGE